MTISILVFGGWEYPYFFFSLNYFLIF
jgi:hypothetical protein